MLYKSSKGGTTQRCRMVRTSNRQLRDISYWLIGHLYCEFAWFYDPVSRLVSLGAWNSIRNLALDYVI